MKYINLGILGAADIVKRSVIEPARYLENLKIYAIASRTKEKASAFAQTHALPMFFEGYDTLLQCEEIDAVYIALINSLHADYTIKAIEAGKHVLVEKPICLNSKDIARIESCLQEHPRVVVLEGLMSQHHPFNSKIQEIIQNKIFGELMSIKTKACYKLNKPDDFRLFPEKGGSVFFDEGLLWCHLTQICIGLHPLGFTAQCDFNGPHGGDHTFRAALSFPDGVSSDIFCSLAHPYQADHFLKFEKAGIKIINFWRPTFGEQKLKFEITKHNSAEIEYFTFGPQNYFLNQLAFFLEVIQGISNNIPINNSFERIKLMEKIFFKSKGNRVDLPG